jgi:hypothetical protein
MNATEVLQRCGKCAAENRIAIDSLEAGVARDDQADPHVVPLVNQVHAELVKRKKVIGALKDKQGRVDATVARPVSPEDVQQWFSKGLKIELREVEQSLPPKEPGQ